MTAKTPDLHYYGPQYSRFPSREAWRNSSQNWNTPTGPNPTPKLRIDDGEEHPVTIRKIEAENA